MATLIDRDNNMSIPSLYVQNSGQYYLSGHQWVLAPLLIMVCVSSCVETAKFGAIVVVESKMDVKMPEFACPILGFR
jgi:hypothetical protein